MADETTDESNKPTTEQNTPEIYARSARDSADEANAALREIQRLHGEIMARGKAAPAAAGIRPPTQGVPKTGAGPVGTRKGAPPEPEPEYEQRRDVDENSRKACLCGAPLWAHEERAPFGCPDNGCPEFHLAPR